MSVKEIGVPTDRVPSYWYNVGTNIVYLGDVYIVHGWYVPDHAPTFTYFKVIRAASEQSPEDKADKKVTPPLPCMAFGCLQEGTRHTGNWHVGEGIYCEEHYQELVGTLAKQEDSASVDQAPKDTINGPPHYTVGGLQPIEYMKMKMTKEQYEGFLLGNVIKYVNRYPYKNGLEDLKKAQYYLNALINEHGANLEPVEYEPEEERHS